MINWFDMPAEGLSNGGQFEVKELEVTENGTYETKGEMYNKVTVNVEGGGGSWQTVFEGSVTTVMSVDFALADITDLESLSGDSIKVTFNGTEYILPKVADGYGAMTQDEMPDFSEYPLFIVTLEQPYTIYTETAGTYTLKIEEPQSGGSSDFSTAEITLQNVSEIISTLRVSMGVCMSETPNPMTGNYIDIMGTTNVPRGGTGIQKVLLYHGEVNVRFSADEIVSVEGNIVDTGSGLYKITGDCSVIAKGIGQA